MQDKQDRVVTHHLPVIHLPGDFKQLGKVISLPLLVFSPTMAGSLIIPYFLTPPGSLKPAWFHTGGLSSPDKIGLTKEKDQ
jgi:hypothetical protein